MSGDDKTSTARPTREDIEAARAMLNTAVMSGRRETVADILASAELVTRYSRVLDYALDCLTAEQEAETVPDEGAPQVEPPEDAGDGWGPWIDWAGGECPVNAGDLVRVQIRDGGAFTLPAVADSSWLHLFGRADIVRYRVRLPEPAPESDAAFLARHGVGEWVASDLDSGEHSRDWRSAWWAISLDGFLYLADASTCRLNPTTPGDTTTPEGRAECDARLVAHLRAEGRT